MRMPESRDMAPEDIEKRSFEIIAAELGETDLPAETLPVVLRVVHATADFDFARALRFSDGAVAVGVRALAAGCDIVTDTQMAGAGVNKRALRALGGEVRCHVADEDVAAAAARDGVTRSRAAVDKAASLWPEAVYAVGNAPTALLRICELIAAGKLRPRLVVGVPVGFVNVVESKEALTRAGVPYIAAMGRKGGSTVAAAICNALVYSA